MLKFLKRLCVVLLASLSLYSLLGFWVLPKTALYFANQQLPHYATLPAQIRDITFNPFTLKLTVSGLQLGTDAQPQFSLEQLSTTLEWSSLWERMLHIRTLEFSQPKLHIQRDAKGLNLSRWFRIPETTPEPSDSNTTLPEVQIDRIQLSDGQWHFQDSTLQPAFNVTFDQWQIGIQQFSTRADHQTQITLETSSQHHPKLSWQGTLGLSPLQVKGHLKIEALDLAPLRGYLSQYTPLVLERGQLSLNTELQVHWDKSLQLTLNQLSTQTTALNLSTHDKRPLVRLKALDIAQASVDLKQRLIRIGQLDSQKLETWLAREADGQLDWQKLFAPQKTTTNATPPTKSKTDKTPEWRVVLDKIRLQDYRLHLADRQPKTPLSLELNALNLAVQHLDTQAKTPFQMQLDTRIGLHGRLKANGQFNLNSGQGNLQLETHDLDLRVAQPYLSPFVAIELRSGMLATDLGIQLSRLEPLAFQVKGQAEVTQLHTLDARKNQDLLKWQHLKVSGIDYRHQERLNINRIDVVHPYARFVINPDLSTNLSQLQTTPATQAATARRDAKPSTARPTKTADLGIEIGGIHVIDGSAYFADRSLEPDFATSIQGLSGDIGRLDNQQPRPARVVLKGKVDRYSPVSIEGTLSPFDPLQHLDLTARFHQLEMTNLTPYSGKFAGYRIRKGRLDLDLHYRILQRRLEAENKIVVHQLQLGERVQSPNAADIPVRLAIALLKDSTGTITLDIPIQGNLDDPKFSIMPLIGQSLQNLITKAVQAPFRLLGELVGQSQTSLGQVLFAPGTTELDTEARTTLNKLAGALKARPELMLEVEGASSPNLDGLLMAQQYLEREYRLLWYRTLQRRGEKVPANPEALQVSEQAKNQMLDEIYQARLKKAPPPEWAQLAESARQDRLRQAILQSWSQSKTVLRTLSQERASIIKQYLVTQGKLDNTRIYLLDSNLEAENHQGKVALALYLAGQ